MLASGSPRRKDLLAALGLDFDIHAATAEELGRDSGLPPEDLVRLNAAAKAGEISSSRPDSVVIGADTCVALSGRVFGKPSDYAEAVSMLTELCGRWHQVFTGFCIKHLADNIDISRCLESRVFLADFGLKVIENYCATGEPLDKAGAYAVQGIGGFMVREIKGSYTNVVGLPMTELAEDLLNIGAIRACAVD